MNKLDYIKEVAQRSGQDITQVLVNNETFKEHISRAFNMFYKDMNNRYEWPWREKTWNFQTIANYTTGTLTVTNGSRTITGVGTNFTTAMEERYIKLDRDTDAYRIVNRVDATTLTISEPYIGNSGSGLNYIIWNKFYDLPPDVPFLSDLYVWWWPNRSNPIPFKDFDSSFKRAYLSGIPYAWSWYGIDRRLSRYSAGTVSTTKNSKTFTGSGTSFIDNVFPGSKITVGTNVYNVETIDSDTTITLVQNAIVDTSAAAYTADTQNRSRIVLSTTPNPVMNIYVTYRKKTYDLVNDIDEPEFWEGYESILANVIYGYILEKLTSEKAFAWLTIYERQIKDAWRTINDKDIPDSPIIYRSGSTSEYRKSIYS